MHKEKVKSYNQLKSDLIGGYESDPNTVILEFDYAQNLPVPKLNCTKQFYKRLLWFYIFNVHVHNCPHSFMYGCMESEAKKNTNSVISLVYRSLIELIDREPFKCAILFSDACGGQNKNFLLMCFCAWFSEVYAVEILHVYPVRGHSYSICDRNFGIYGKKLKKLPIIQTAAEYLKIIAKSREKPFPYWSTWDPSLFKEWETVLRPFFKRKPTKKHSCFTLQKYCMLKYKPDGTISASKTYTPDFEDFQYWKNADITRQELDIKPSQATLPPLKPAKIADVRALYEFLNEEARTWLNILFKNSVPGDDGQGPSDLSDDDISEY